jgi:hypothetical protein
MHIAETGVVVKTRGRGSPQLNMASAKATIPVCSVRWKGNVIGLVISEMEISERRKQSRRCYLCLHGK